MYLTVLAFDFGEKRIGVAQGTTFSKLANPLKTIAFSTSTAKFDAIKKVIDEWQPNQLVVGRPLHPDGTAHAVTALCERFARQLGGRFNLPVALVDERYTSAIAAQEGAKDIDARAAAIILESYFEQFHP
jgi:putative holliday junction resolvase